MAPSTPRARREEAGPEGAGLSQISGSADQKADGHDRVQIGWVDPVPFYSTTVDARIERVFFRYRKQL